MHYRAYLKLTLLLAIVVGGCERSATQQDAANTGTTSAADTKRAKGSSQSQAAAADSPSAGEEKHFGAPLKAKTFLPIEQVLASPEQYQNEKVAVRGAVRRACRKKGCWMELAASPEEDAPGCRVTFKDYGFFVPTDSAGATARLEGVLHVKTIPAKQVAHLEAEGAQFSRKSPDGSARELRLVATGVALQM